MAISVLSSAMKAIVNGQEKDLTPGTTVRALIEQLGMGRHACAAEVNQALVPRREQDSRVVQEGDRIEVVSLVGGG